MNLLCLKAERLQYFKVVLKVKRKSSSIIDHKRKKTNERKDFPSLRIIMSLRVPLMKKRETKKHINRVMRKNVANPTF